MAKKTLMYIREAFTLENNYFTLKHSSPIVGNTGIAFASEFSNEIYLCGMDLGFRLGEKKHANGSFYDDKNDIEKNGIKVKGNFSNDIYSNSLLLSSKKNIEKLIKEKNIKIYNLSDGAYIEGSIPLKNKDLPKIDKQKYIKEITKCFYKTKSKDKKPNIKKLLLAISKAMDIKVDSKEKLTSLMEGLEDLIKTYEQIDKETFLLLRGSLFHILNNLYILSFKIDFREYTKLAKIVKKEIFKFEEYLDKVFK
jgi:hypothetical protein